MEMYSTDWSGHYPGDGLAKLTPNYLKTIPECPSAGAQTYRVMYGRNGFGNEEGYNDYYYVWCHGNHHEPVGVWPGFPRYDGIRGLTKRFYGYKEEH